MSGEDFLSSNYDHGGYDVVVVDAATVDEIETAREREKEFPPSASSSPPQSTTSVEYNSSTDLMRAPPRSLLAEMKPLLTCLGSDQAG